MLFANAIGNITRDPEQTENGARIVIACNAPNDTVDYVNCYVYGKVAESVLTYLHKGDKVAAHGSFHANIRETDDNVYLNLNMNASNIEFISVKREDAKETPKRKFTR